MNVERKLVTIRKIINIQPIENADFIELATVDGWNVVVKKDTFKINDLCVYFEIDSFLPIKEEFEFLRKSTYRKMGDVEGFRLKTIKLRGCVSQGLILPLNELKVLLNDNTLFVNLKEGDDLTDKLNVIKWEPPIHPSLSGKVKGNFPSFIPKTNQERIQNIGLSKLKKNNCTYEVTLKLNGSSCTYYYNNGVFGVCSRNLDLIETDDNSFWILAKKLKLQDKMSWFGANLAIQGELIGPNIQNNYEGVKSLEFYCFDIWNIDTQKYLNYEARIHMSKYFEIPHAPIVEYTDLDKFNDISDILKYAERPSMNKNTNAEGVVFKTDDHSFKVISNFYLMKNDTE